MKKHAPATLRNRDAIVDVLQRELPDSGIVLEVASGSGEHAVYFADRFPRLVWQPTDPSPGALESIAAYRADYAGKNLLAPLFLDASEPSGWPKLTPRVILCINMVHISPWAATEGLFTGASKLLETGAPLILYGPYFEEGIEPAPSNLAFDQSLRERDPAWGIRTVQAIDELAASHGFDHTGRYAMPANNLMLVYQRS